MRVVVWAGVRTGISLLRMTAPITAACPTAINHAMPASTANCSTGGDSEPSARNAGHCQYGAWRCDARAGFHSLRQLLANAVIAASRLSALPCVGVRSSCCPKASAHIQGDPTGAACTFKIRPTTAPGHNENGFNLGLWVNRQRTNKDGLSKERRQGLDEIGFAWNVRQGRS